MSIFRFPKFRILLGIFLLCVVVSAVSGAEASVEEDQSNVGEKGPSGKDGSGPPQKRKEVFNKFTSIYEDFLKVAGSGTNQTDVRETEGNKEGDKKEEGNKSGEGDENSGSEEEEEEEEEEDERNTQSRESLHNKDSSELANPPKNPPPPPPYAVEDPHHHRPPPKHTFHHRPGPGGPPGHGGLGGHHGGPPPFHKKPHHHHHHGGHPVHIDHGGHGGPPKGTFDISEEDAGQFGFSASGFLALKLMKIGLLLIPLLFSIYLIPIFLPSFLLFNYLSPQPVINVHLPPDLFKEGSEGSAGWSPTKDVVQDENPQGYKELPIHQGVVYNVNDYNNNNNNNNNVDRPSQEYGPPSSEYGAPSNQFNRVVPPNSQELKTKNETFIDRKFNSVLGIRTTVVR